MEINSTEKNSKKEYNHKIYFREGLEIVKKKRVSIKHFEDTDRFFTRSNDNFVD